MLTNEQLIKYCIDNVGEPYWYGCFGQTANSTLYSLKKTQYPNYYTSTDYESQYGKRVFDCIGLIKGAIWSNGGQYNPIYTHGCPDITANQMINKCIEQGEIKTIPEIKGLCVWMNNHIGVYIGNGEVVEARGHAYGVQKTKLVNRPFVKWGKIPYITYDNVTPDPVTNWAIKNNIIDSNTKLNENATINDVVKMLYQMYN